MSSRGFTVVELLVALVTSLIIGMVSAKLFQAGLKTYSYTARQSAALSNGAAAMRGEARRKGLAPRARAGRGIQGLVANTLMVGAPDSVVSTFTVTAGRLYRKTAGVTRIQAPDVESLAVNYYNLDGSDLIAESTQPARATLVTFKVTVRGLPGSQKSHTLFSGSQMRNHP